MKILFTRFPLESAHGGAENQTIRLMLGLQKRGHAVGFLGSCPVLLDLCKRNNIPHAQLRIGPPPVTVLGAISFLWRKRTIRQALRTALDTFEGMDAVCMMSLTEKILLTDIAVQKGMKVLWQEHDMVGRWLRKNPSLARLRTLSNAVTTVCVSELSANIFRDLGYKNVVAVPNGVPLPSEDFVRHEYDETLRVGCIARLSPEKGIDVLLDAMKNVPDATVLINGKGSVYVQSSRTVTVRANVPDVDEIYKQIDVLVLPSRTEDPFGLVVAEAMMRGIPAICTDACGIAAYLTDGKDAIIVPAGDSAALAKAISGLHDAKKRSHLSAGGRKTALRKYTVEKMTEEYEKILRAE